MDNPEETVQKELGDLINVMQNSTSSSEVAYGTTPDETSRVMSEKVQVLASSIYKELELMIQRHGEESIKELMPLVVNVLESLDMAYNQKEENFVDLEMLKEEYEQLMNQYERERQMRKNQDQKFFEQEEALVEQNRGLETKVEGLESNVRLLELKLRNSQDHAQRCDEREAEQKVEFEKLHERYNDLLRTHIDHVERSKYMMGADKFDMMHSLPPGHTKGMTASVDTNVRGMTDIISAAMSQSVNVNLANHISAERDFHDEFGQNTEELLDSGREEKNPIIDELEKHLEESEADNSKTEGRENEDDTLTAQLTGNLVDPAEFASAVNDAFIGMGREVDNLIKENTELLETKNALNIVKNDLIAQVDQLSSENDVLQEEIRTIDIMRSKQSDRIKELETEIKNLRDKIAADELEEQNIPLAQKKRFTRVEMARVLMERNQYKEKLMELQEAVKFTELQRAKKINSSNQPQSKGLWNFFSGLFGETPPTTPSSSARKPRRSSSTMRKETIHRNFDVVEQGVADKRMADRRQQYKAVSQHMKQEDETRTRAYGWSIPSTIDTNNATSIPVPVCCRPLLDQQPSLKIWCAVGVILHGGRDSAGNYIIDDSVINGDPIKTISDKLDPLSNSKLTEERSVWEASSLIWVCSSNEKRSFVTVLDSNNPNCILDCFTVCKSHLLCITSVPGVRENDHDLEVGNEVDFNRPGGYLSNLPPDLGADQTFGEVTWISLKSSVVDNIPTYKTIDEKSSPRRNRDFSVSEPTTEDTGEAAPDEGANAKKANMAKRVSFEVTGLNDPLGRPACTPLEKAALERTDLVIPHEQQKSPDDSERKLAAYANIMPHLRDALGKYESHKSMGTALPTMWMGLEDDYIMIHSAVLDWKESLARIKLSDAVLQLLHHKGRVFAALANGTIAVFHRATNGHWLTTGYHVIKLGQTNTSVCNLTIVADKMWIAYKNCVIVLNPDSLIVEDSFVAHPRRDSQIRHMVWCGSGVWLSVRLDSTIRLYHARTMKHLQDVDIEPYLNNMLGNAKMDFLHLRISALRVFDRKLWIGTGTGIIISVPLSSSENEKVEIMTTSDAGSAIKSPGSLVRVYGSDKNANTDDNRFVPYCNIAQAQFSFHGHKDAVRFFVCVPSEGVSSLTQVVDTRKILMLSGGDGYIDFRLGEDDENEQNKSDIRIRDMSHLIVWEIVCQNPYKEQTDKDLQ